MLCTRFQSHGYLSRSKISMKFRPSLRLQRAPQNFSSFHSFKLSKPSTLLFKSPSIQRFSVKPLLSLCAPRLCSPTIQISHCSQQKPQIPLNELPEVGLFGINSHKFVSKVLAFAQKRKAVYFLMDKEGWLDLGSLYKLYPAQFQNRAPRIAKGVYQDPQKMIALMQSHRVNKESLGRLFEVSDCKTKIRLRGQLWDSVKMWHRLKFGEINQNNSKPLIQN